MPAATKEEMIFSVPGDPRALFPLAAFEGVPENSRQGVATQTRITSSGFEVANSQIAVGDTRSVREKPHRVPLFYKFTGHERDSESGLDHTLHRQHASNLGRWLSADPVRGKSGNPQTWNRYSYGASNPTNMIDAEGADPCPVNPPPDSPGCIEVVAPPIPVNPYDASIPSGLDPWGYQGGGGLFTPGGSGGNEDARDGYDSWQQGFNERQQEKLETLCSTFTNPLPSGVCPDGTGTAQGLNPILATFVNPLPGDPFSPTTDQILPGTGVPDLPGNMATCSAYQDGTGFGDLMTAICVSLPNGPFWNCSRGKLQEYFVPNGNPVNHSVYLFMHFPIWGSCILP